MKSGMKHRLLARAENVSANVGWRRHGKTYGKTYGKTNGKTHGKSHPKLLLLAGLTALIPLALSGSVSSVAAEKTSGAADSKAKSASAKETSAKGKEAHVTEADPLAGVTIQIDDLEATIRITKCNPAALEKISPDFKKSYTLMNALHNVAMHYKTPDKLRFDGRNPVLGSAVIIMNGPLRVAKVPRIQTKIEDLKDSPGKRQSLLEYGGLIAPDLVKFMKAKLVREEAVDEQPATVYDLTYLGVGGGSHYRVWIDAKTHITVKRVWLDRDNKVKATFFYREPREVTPGFWLPSVIEISNADGELAATTSIEDVKINQGLADDLFAIQQ